MCVQAALRFKGIVAAEQRKHRGSRQDSRKNATLLLSKHLPHTTAGMPDGMEALR